MTAILTAILIHQLYDISVHYFSFEYIMTIDTKTYESDHNYPFISFKIKPDFHHPINDIECLKLEPLCKFNYSTKTNKLIIDSLLYNNYLYNLSINSMASVDSYYTNK